MSNIKENPLLTGMKIIAEGDPISVGLDEIKDVAEKSLAAYEDWVKAPRGVTAKSYTLKNEHGSWLGQVVLTSDGMLGAVTDYGNLSYAWARTGMDDFRKFLIGLNVEYFGTKMFTGMAYMISAKQYEKACQRFAEKILPALQEVLKKEIEDEQ